MSSQGASGFICPFPFGKDLLVIGGRWYGCNLTVLTVFCGRRSFQTLEKCVPCGPRTTIVEEDPKGCEVVEWRAGGGTGLERCAGRPSSRLPETGMSERALRIESKGRLDKHTSRCAINAAYLCKVSLHSAMRGRILSSSIQHFVKSVLIVEEAGRSFTSAGGIPVARLRITAESPDTCAYGIMLNRICQNQSATNERFQSTRRTSSSRHPNAQMSLDNVRRGVSSTSSGLRYR